jgi:hypothetical protein
MTFTDKMLADETVRRKLIDWAVASATGTDRAAAVQACTSVCALWRFAIMDEVVDRLKQQRRADDSCVF